MKKLSAAGFGTRNFNWEWPRPIRSWKEQGSHGRVRQGNRLRGVPGCSGAGGRCSSTGKALRSGGQYLPRNGPPVPREGAVLHRPRRCPVPQGDLDGAVDAYKKAVRHDPAEDKAYLGLGAAYERKGNLEEALKAYQKAWEINPDLSQAARKARISGCACSKKTRAGRTRGHGA